MAKLCLYASLCVTLDGKLLEQECEVSIERKVNEPIRVTVVSMVPSSASGGPEVDVAELVGERVRIGVHEYTGRKTGRTLVEFEGTVSEARESCWSTNGHAMRNAFTVSADPVTAEC